MSRPLIKVCGVRSTEIARAAMEAGADRLGLVFAPSPRRVDDETAERLVGATPAAWVGVFVDAPLAAIERRARRLDLAALQLHGSESPEACRRLREATERAVWKAIPWGGDPLALDAWVGSVDAVLLDARRGSRFGGTGRALPWDEIGDRLPGRERSIAVIVAGGLDPDNVEQAIRACDPDGVDASSGLERSPGRKDPVRVRAFVERARAALADRVAGGSP